jgi:hypothetical protein
MVGRQPSVAARGSARAPIPPRPNPILRHSEAPCATADAPEPGIALGIILATMMLTTLRLLMILVVYSRLAETGAKVEDGFVLYRQRIPTPDRRSRPGPTGASPGYDPTVPSESS